MKVDIKEGEFKELILQGKTIPELQKIYGNCSRDTIAQAKRKFGFVGLTPNNKRINREEGLKVCSTCKVEKSLRNFYSNGVSSTGLIKYKPSCNTCESTTNYNSFYTKIEKYLHSRNKSYHCEKCKGTNQYGFLEFHHTNPQDKDFNIGSYGKTVSEEKFTLEVIPELDKCILLCPNCHKIEHIIMG